MPVYFIQYCGDFFTSPQGKDSNKSPHDPPSPPKKIPWMEKAAAIVVVVVASRGRVGETSNTERNETRLIQIHVFTHCTLTTAPITNVFSF